MSLRKNLIYLPALLMDMSTGSAILAITFLASRFGASPLVIGTMASANTLLYVLFCQIFGKLSDRVSRKRITQLACLSFFVLYLFIPLCKNLTQLIFLFPLTGVTLSALWPALEAWVGERADGRPLIKRLRMFNISWTIGLILGFVSGGYICDLDPSAPLYFASISALCAAVAITVQSKSVRRSAGESADPLYREADNKAQSNPQLVSKYLYLSRVAIFVSWLTLGIMRYIFPKLIYELGMAPRVFGLLMLCQTGGQLLMFFILGTTERWHFRFTPLAVLQILAGFSFISIWLIDSPVFWAFALIFVGFNTGMTYFSSMYYSFCGHADLGGKSGWHESIIHSGVFFSTLIGGALANYVSFKSPYLFCAIATFIGLPVQIIILLRNKS